MLVAWRITTCEGRVMRRWQRRHLEACVEVFRYGCRKQARFLRAAQRLRQREVTAALLCWQRSYSEHESMLCNAKWVLGKLRLQRLSRATQVLRTTSSRGRLVGHAHRKAFIYVTHLGQRRAWGSWWEAHTWARERVKLLAHVAGRMRYRRLNVMLQAWDCWSQERREKKIKVSITQLCMQGSFLLWLGLSVVHVRNGTDRLCTHAHFACPHE
jgi:hypothetical protein